MGGHRIELGRRDAVDETREDALGHLGRIDGQAGRALGDTLLDLLKGHLFPTTVAFYDLHVLHEEDELRVRKEPHPVQLFLSPF